MTYVQSLNQFKDPIRRKAVEIARGLVRHQEAWLTNERAGKRDALLFPSRKLAGAVVTTIFQPHFAKPVCCFCQCLVPCHAARQKRHGDVLKRRELRQQIMELPNVTNLAVTECRRFICGERRDIN
jgi:hypothetical protein